MQTSSTAWSISSDELVWQPMPEQRGHVQTLPANIGCCQSRLFIIDPDFSCIETHYSPKRNLAVLSRIHEQQARMVVTLGLKGNSRFSGAHGDEIIFKAGYTTITTFNASEGSRQYQADQAVSQLRFSITPAWLAYHFGSDAIARHFQKNATQLISHQRSSPTALIAAHGFLNNALATKAQPLFRQSQAMAILACELAHLLGESDSYPVRVNPKDKRIADLARDILLAEFTDPPSVEALSKRVGTNSFKLKRLFHYCFNSTIYGIVLEARMAKARQLLSSESGSVNEVAHAVGYHHASSFSAAFLKHFGIAPKYMAKSR